MTEVRTMGGSPGTTGHPVGTHGRRRSLLAIAPALLMALLACSCTTAIGPSISAYAGPGRSVGVFKADKRECMDETDRALQPVADRLNTVATTADRIASNNAWIQKSYDEFYGRCLLSRNDVLQRPVVDVSVPDSPTPEIAIHGGQRAIDASTTPGLSDPLSEEAERFTRRAAHDLLAQCPGDTVRIDAHEAPIAPGVVARLVGLTEPHGGDCLGSMGEIDYLVVLRRPGWSTLLSGYLGILDSARAGYRDVELRSRGACLFVYGWTGSSYRNIASNGCEDEHSPPVGGYADEIRGR